MRVELLLPPAETVRLEGLSDSVRPEGEELAARLTVPKKPLTELTVIVEVPLEPAVMVREVGFADMVKSGVALEVTVTETWAEWVRLPEVPVTAAV